MNIEVQYSWISFGIQVIQLICFEPYKYILKSNGLNGVLSVIKSVNLGFFNNCASFKLYT